MAAAAPTMKTRLLRPDQALAIRNVRRKSHSNFFCKSIILVSFLLFFQIFPVQAPDFIRQSIVTEFWEIFHLLLIGIAISYGLLSRKTAQIVGETAVHLTTEESLAEFSGISHVTSVFENGFESLYDCDDKQRLVESCLGGQCLQGSIDGRFVAKERREIAESEGNLKKVNQSWFSQCSSCESTAVVSNCKSVVHECIDYKPLNLPVRSLHRSKVDKKDNLESRHGKESCLELKSRKQIDCVDNVQKIRGVVPINLEKRFDEVSGTSSIRWRSSSERTGQSTRSRMSQPSEEFEPDRVSRSFQDSKFSGSHEVAKPKEGHLVGEKDDKSCSTVSASRARNRPSSLGSSSEINGLRVSENSFSHYGGTDMESSSLTKGISRARSVRTIKPSMYLLNENEQLMSRAEEDLSMERAQDPPTDPKFEDDCNFRIARQKPTVSECFTEEEDGGGGSGLELEEEPKTELDKFSSEDDMGTSHENEAELEGSEVDRKADEFIAKFREQIRLQKASST